MAQAFKKLAVVVALLGYMNIAQALDNGLGLTPAMGWNTWNSYGCDINEPLIIKNAKKILDLGLDRLGYKYINVDDCWLTASRNANGHLQVDPLKFFRGIKRFGDDLHSMGLKFGLYNSAGTMTCQ